MSNPSVLGAISWESETAGAFNPVANTGWGETTATFATDRMAITAPVDTTGLERAIMEPGRVVQYLQEGTPYIRTVDGGSFKTKLWLTGHGSTMVGSPTIAAHENLLARVFGSAAALSASASTTLTGGTAAVPTTTASGTFSAGSLCRIGALGDGRGNGQIHAITTHVTTSLTLRGAMGASPTNGDVLYPVVQLLGPEDPTSTAITGTRFLLQTANLQYECHGCFPMSYSITGLNPGEVPSIEVTWGVSWFKESTATFPSATASAAALLNPSPIAAGSWNVQASGTTTRSLRDYRGFSLDVTLGIEPQYGPAGANAYQKIIGARRTPNTIMVTWTENADAATLTPALSTLFTNGALLHGEFTGSTADGSVFGFACPRMCVTNYPIQEANGNINRMTIKCRAHTSTVTTNNLTLAALVIASA